jgi:hypothetical protein
MNDIEEAIIQSKGILSILIVRFLIDAVGRRSGGVGFCMFLFVRDVSQKQRSIPPLSLLGVGDC